MLDRYTCTVTGAPGTTCTVTAFRRRCRQPNSTELSAFLYFRHFLGPAFFQLRHSVVRHFQVLYIQRPRVRPIADFLGYNFINI